jgi:AcrR family transcriptional regulator
LRARLLDLDGFVNSKNTVYLECMTRQYELKARAERQAQTNRRIVEAAIELHEAIGPARTSITAIAERAGVGRLSVYRHFPEEADLLGACSTLYWERNPPPDPEAWRRIADPVERFRVALQESYAYHRRTEPMISRVLADVGEEPVMAPYHEHWARAADCVAAAWRLRGRERRRVRAAIGHALAFATWRSLVREQALSDDQAIGLMLRLVICRDDPHAAEALTG